MVNVPEFDLNEPFDLDTQDTAGITEQEQQDALNQMWRNGCINDTYEPGSTFKIITSGSLSGRKVWYHLSGYIFLSGLQDRGRPENPVSQSRADMERKHLYKGYRIPVIRYLLTLDCGWEPDDSVIILNSSGCLERRAVDLPGEAATIMHKEENIGQVELATMSFGQSFQVTPIQMAATVSALVNGGKRVTPHFGSPDTGQR